ncbi:MAG TPA: CtkA family protein, partial [Candidatus Onthocola stercorigallinarum]|nr:CtkA family protein [Candidatus Onthocola stercorigallinarum]
MIDITNLKQEINTYGGLELKATYIINGERYMVKMPDPVRRKNLDINYMNNQFSEYIGCH